MTNIGMSYADTNQFITYTDRNLIPHTSVINPDGPNGNLEIFTYLDNKTGTVDIKRYLDWLTANQILNSASRYNLAITR